MEVLDDDEATDVRRGDAWVGAERDPAAVEAERLRVRWSVEWRGWRVNDYRVSFAFTKARRDYIGSFVPYHHALPALARLFSRVEYLLSASSEVELELPGTIARVDCSGGVWRDGCWLEVV
jgi:hypothetical protein